jgi:hypothetical protein
MEPSWWNSVESVGRANTWVLAFAAVLGFLAALCVVTSWFTGTRLSYLQDQELNRYKSDADVRISSANESAAKANQYAAEANARAAEANKLAESERLARLRIEEKLAWRRLDLNSKQAVSLREKLLPFSGQEYSMGTYNDDPECIELQTAINSVLVAAGWKYPNPKWGMFAELVRGVVVRMSPNASPSAKHAATALVDGLNESSIVATLTTDKDAVGMGNVIQVRIGKKPN